MNKLFYVRFYSHPRNCHERCLWTAENREELERMVAVYEAETSFRVEVIRFVCNTPDEVADDL
ncbi:MAG: hypothetical protein ACK42H_19495 [Planctomycetota bacterium]|jgi:hypothetical protein